MLSPSTVEGNSVDEHEDMDTEDHLDSSSSHVNDSSKEGEVDDQSNAKPKRNRKSTQRLLDSFMDDELTFTHKQKKKIKPAKKMESSSDTGTSHNESGGDLHSEAASEHEPAVEESEKEKERRTRVVPGKAHVQCTFMESKKKTNSQCKQRAIEGYLFCIWHILNDREAPYKRCAHLRDKNKNGLVSQVQCKTAIKDTQDPPFCLAHSDKVKKPKKRKDSAPSPSPSTRKGGSSETASPVVGGSVAPSSPSSSIFNLPNEEFAQDIDEALGNMDAGNLMDTWDDFESLDDEDEWKEEEEDTVASGGTVAPPVAPLPFEVDDELDEQERGLMDDVVVPIFNVGRKIIDRLARMRDHYTTGDNDDDFWKACDLHPDAPSTAEEYMEQFVSEGRFERMAISASRKEEILGLVRDPASELFQELELIHKYNTDLLREQLTLQRSKINNHFG